MRLQCFLCNRKNRLFSSFNSDTVLLKVNNKMLTLRNEEVSAYWSHQGPVGLLYHKLQSVLNTNKMLDITQVSLKRLREKKNCFCDCTPECQIRLPGWFELDMMAPRNDSQFTYPNENPPFKSNESNEALHKSTNPTAHTILKVKSPLIPQTRSLVLSFSLPSRDVSCYSSLLSLPLLSSSISPDNSIISARVTCPDPLYRLNLLETEREWEPVTRLPLTS